MDTLERTVRGVPVVLAAFLAVFYLVFVGPLTVPVLVGLVAGIWGAMERQPHLLAVGAFVLFVVSWVPFQSMQAAQLFVGASFLLAARYLGTFPVWMRYGILTIGAVALLGGVAIGALDAVRGHLEGRTLQFVAYHALWSLGLLTYGGVAVWPLPPRDTASV